LSAVFSYVNQAMYQNDRLPKELTIKVGEDLFRVEPADGQRMELRGRTLQSEGVVLWPVSQ
jgi:hypothetical protein